MSRYIRVVRDGIQYARHLTREGQQAYRGLIFKKRSTLDLSIVRWRSMLTLTLDPKRLGDLSIFKKEGETDVTYQQLLHRYIMKVWKNFRARCWRGKTYLNKKTGFSRHREFKFKYLLVVEWTKKGFPHLHVLIDRFLPKGFTQNSWVSCGGGEVMRFSWLGNDAHYKRAVLYMMKYVHKDINKECRGCRRWAYTNGILPKIEKPERDVEDVYECVGVREMAKTGEIMPTIIYGDENGEEIYLAPCELAEKLGLITWAEYPAPLREVVNDDRKRQG